MPSITLPTAPAPLLRAPLHDNGRLALGPALTGGGHAFYPLAAPRQLRHGVIVGDAGTGVSNALTVAAVIARAAMPLVTAYVNGHSAPLNAALARQSTVAIARSSGCDVAATAIAALERAVLARAQVLTELRAASFPAAGIPPLLVIIKDAHEVFAGHGERWAKVMHHAGKLGIGVLAALHDMRLTSFGGSAALRARLTEQVIALRTGCMITQDILVKTAVSANPEFGRPGSRDTEVELAAQLRKSLRDAPTGAGHLIVAHENPVAFASFRLAAGSAMIERGRERWLKIHPDTELDAPTRAAFGELAHRGGA
ncbi:hypothetical protein [Amycolatopsis sp. NPDC051903]|uniref:hypothetical protein n=1 Tax=Amycolatopsis sp. NPDC051903 TaxID=3363936 RepID=UPI0037B6E3CE